MASVFRLLLRLSLADARALATLGETLSFRDKGVPCALQLRFLLCVFISLTDSILSPARASNTSDISRPAALLPTPAVSRTLSV